MKTWLAKSEVSLGLHKNGVDWWSDKRLINNWRHRSCLIIYILYYTICGQMWIGLSSLISAPLLNLAFERQHPKVFLEFVALDVNTSQRIGSVGLHQDERWPGEDLLRNQGKLREVRIQRLFYFLWTSVHASVCDTLCLKGKPFGYCTLAQTKPYQVPGTVATSDEL